MSAKRSSKVFCTVAVSTDVPVMNDTPMMTATAVNAKRMTQLVEDGLAAAQGLAAFERRDRKITQKYSFERKNAAFDAPTLRTFKANRPAWAFFTAQPPGYQKLMTFWVMSARQEETRLRRLATLAERSAKGERIR